MRESPGCFNEFRPGPLRGGAVSRIRETHPIKGPVQLVASTYRKLALESIPGVSDFNELCSDPGQVPFFPPNVAGWAGHKTWVNPAALLTRGNFVQTLLFPPDPMTMEPPDKDIHPGCRKIPILNIASRQSFAVNSGVHAPVVFKDPDKFGRVGTAEQWGASEPDRSG